ncbi:uncharacterized protein LOC111296285 [Durio zibethinus]|uniref:Uncharacterized protein LOC111296285 n=1 Tax=Durio zibethinus TaxID=66656 RepID=A0A6P5Z1N3_DURZI|nr:uncharacterized protein LOC111296285 [Durio zibethinus]
MRPLFPSLYKPEPETSMLSKNPCFSVTFTTAADQYLIKAHGLLGFLFDTSGLLTNSRSSLTKNSLALLRLLGVLEIDWKLLITLCCADYFLMVFCFDDDGD